ncbi:Regulator of G-protein signaling 9-binding protein [Bagarius yarrelli]|uniref:Regulator of G-protein signaling 9-binding protein n=1 Tax=Bagarius yarrelli TaxID=175774 RepID=A0A556U3L4_BAGYA|nr:Regulator of G-protein signaling 9-binding protein [Bagarius yarrelli]
MNRWRRSVGEIQARKRLVSECEQAQAAVNNLTACFQQMATCLGSNTDSNLLRDELEETRGQAHKICAGLHQRLLELLVETEQGQDDREQVERLWVLLLSTLEKFQQELRKVSALQELFPVALQKDRQVLVNTGASGGGTEVAGRAAMVQSPWVVMECKEKPDLYNHVLEIESLLQEMLQRVNVPLWSVEPMQNAWAEGTQEEDDDILEEMMQVEVVSQDGKSGCCSHTNCKLGCIFCLLN